MKKNNIKITRLAGKGTICEAIIKVKFDSADPEAVKRFARVVRELGFEVQESH